MSETPQISNSCYANHLYVPEFANSNIGIDSSFTTTTASDCAYIEPACVGLPTEFMSGPLALRSISRDIDKPKKEKKMADRSLYRFVRVIVADVDESLPLEKALLYDSGEKFTNATDQELFFEIEIKPLLDAHNEYRKTVVDRKTSAKMGKEVFLEPIRIRDLRMSIVNIANF